jgi:hypothetical protein
MSVADVAAGCGVVDRCGVAEWLVVPGPAVFVDAGAADGEGAVAEIALDGVDDGGSPVRESVGGDLVVRQQERFSGLGVQGPGSNDGCDVVGGQAGLAEGGYCRVEVAGGLGDEGFGGLEVVDDGGGEAGLDGDLDLVGVASELGGEDDAGVAPGVGESLGGGVTAVVFVVVFDADVPVLLVVVPGRDGPVLATDLAPGEGYDQVLEVGHERPPCWLVSVSTELAPGSFAPGCWVVLSSGGSSGVGLVALSGRSTSPGSGGWGGLMSRMRSGG